MRGKARSWTALSIRGPPIWTTGKRPRLAGRRNPEGDPSPRDPSWSSPPSAARVLPVSGRNDPDRDDDPDRPPSPAVRERQQECEPRAPVQDRQPESRLLRALIATAGPSTCPAKVVPGGRHWPGPRSRRPRGWVVRCDSTSPGKLGEAGGDPAKPGRWGAASRAQVRAGLLA